MEEAWGLEMPPMIINVTGNAAPFEMRPKFKDIFCEALMKATESSGAWVCRTACRLQLDSTPAVACWCEPTGDQSLTAFTASRSQRAALMEE